MLNQKFLNQLKNLFTERSVHIEASAIWNFIIEACQEDREAIEGIMRAGHIIDYGYLRETLS